MFDYAESPLRNDCKLILLETMQKTCPECHKTFECSQSEGCWCTRITIPEDVANYLRGKYFDCLCEECMTKILKNKEKILAGK